MNVVITCESASFKFGGEASLPLHYYRVLRKREGRVWLVTHERTRKELEELFPRDQGIFYVKDRLVHKVLYKIGRLLPDRMSYFTFGYAMRFLCQIEQRKIVSRIVRENAVEVVHQPMPVSPREPSLMFCVGAPVVIGPMNGDINFPEAFRSREGIMTRLALKVGRWMGWGLNLLFPGKRFASALIVANKRTAASLPCRSANPVFEIVENGVDLSVWCQGTRRDHNLVPVRLVFVGRLVEWKAVDLLIEAFVKASQQVDITLNVLGDGDQRDRLEGLAAECKVLSKDKDQTGKVCFCGWKSQIECSSELLNSDLMVLPSLMECGGAVVLEAMACGLPVIATDWGGPSDYLDPTCGVLVSPTGREEFVRGIADAIVTLSGSPELRARMGEAGRSKVIECYDWERKVDSMIDVYQSLVKRNGLVAE